MRRIRDAENVAAFLLLYLAQSATFTTFSAFYTSKIPGPKCVIALAYELVILSIK